MRQTDRSGARFCAPANRLIADFSVPYRLLLWFFLQQHPEARIVMVSSVGYQENIVAAWQRGARHFVQKPVKPDALYEIIRYVLNDDGVTAPVGAAGENAR